MGRMFYDIYDPKDPKTMDDNAIMHQILWTVTSQFRLKEYERRVIPCQSLPDPGVSGIILAQNFHFTCHTFSRRGAIYLDVFGVSNAKYEKKITQLIKEEFMPDRIVSHSPECFAAGNFGRHLIFSLPPIDFTTAYHKVKEIVGAIDMHCLAPVMFLGSSRMDYDILQPIVESHIAIHTNRRRTKVDVFSCKYFDETRALALFSDFSDLHLIPRGSLND